MVGKFVVGGGGSSDGGRGGSSDGGVELVVVGKF